MSVESAVNVGSSFRVWLPLTLNVTGESSTDIEQENEIEVSTENTAIAPTTQKRILVIEDQPFNQTLITEILEMHDYAVEIIDNGQTMLDRLQDPAPKQLPDLVLMDIQLPYVDGFILTAALKRHSDWSPIPVIAITALAMAGDRQRCIDAGADDYLSKPIQIQALEEKLEQYLS